MDYRGYSRVLSTVSLLVNLQRDISIIFKRGKRVNYVKGLAVFYISDCCGKSLVSIIEIAPANNNIS